MGEISRTVVNRRPAVKAMTKYQRDVIACFVEAGQRELQLGQLWHKFVAKQAGSTSKDVGLSFSAALRSLQDEGFVHESKVLDDNSRYFQELEKALFDLVVSHPAIVGANADPRVVTRKTAK